MKKIAITTILLLALPVILSAQTGLTGKWQEQTPNGPGDVSLDLLVEQETLSGTVTDDGETETIIDGKVSKNTFTFKVTHNNQTYTFTGELDGDEIKVSMDREGPGNTKVFKRVKR